MDSWSIKIRAGEIKGFRFEVRMHLAQVQVQVGGREAGFLATLACRPPPSPASYSVFEDLALSLSLSLSWTCSFPRSSISLLGTCWQGSWNILRAFHLSIKSGRGLAGEPPNDLCSHQPPTPKLLSLPMNDWSNIVVRSLTAPAICNLCVPFSWVYLL